MEKPPNRNPRDFIWQLAGWILFVLSAIFFMVSGVKNRDMAGIAGSAFFLIACVVFMVPLVRFRRK